MIENESARRRRWSLRGACSLGGNVKKALASDVISY